MMTVTLTGDKELAKSLDNAARDLPKEQARVLNATRKPIVGLMTKQIQTKIGNVKTSPVKKVLKNGQNATRSRLATSVNLEETQRLRVDDFKGTRQTKVGVSYSISKTSGRKIIKSGFMGPRPGRKAPKLGGRAYKRTGSGRYPIVQLHVVSPWGVYIKNNMRTRTVKLGEIELHKQMERRIRENILRRQGLI